MAAIIFLFDGASECVRTTARLSITKWVITERIISEGAIAERTIISRNHGVSIARILRNCESEIANTRSGYLEIVSRIEQICVSEGEVRACRIFQ
jgi:hypothetical protein